MTPQQTVEAFTVIVFGGLMIAFTIGELIVTWRRELRRNHCKLPR